MQCRFRGAIGRSERDMQGARHGPHHDDGAPAPLPHTGQHRLGESNGPKDIGHVELLEVIHRNVFQRTDLTLTGIVDEDVHLTGLGNAFSDAGLIGLIEPQVLHPGDAIGDGVGIATGSEYAVSPFCEDSGRTRADPAGSAGDQDGPVFRHGATVADQGGRFAGPPPPSRSALLWPPRCPPVRPTPAATDDRCARCQVGRS
ncbi:Uncharacterised protein [Mycobacteroides abscessus subsp. abscessus]|nr:Uncharacterised protein [Mycobacteroides abscessus subsp. abscessus]